MHFKVLPEVSWGFVGFHESFRRITKRLQGGGLSVEFKVRANEVLGELAEGLEAFQAVLVDLSR